MSENTAQSEQLWNMLHDEIADAMRMEKQPEPENPMLGELTAIKRTYRVFQRMAALGYDIIIPSLEPAKPAESVPAVEGRSIVGAVIGAPKVIFTSTLGKIGSGVKKVGGAIAHGLNLVPEGKPKEEG